jgi:hypothetical protein
MGNPFKAAGRYVKRVLLGIDQLGNTIMGGAPDETISARTGRNKDKKGWRVLAKVLNTIDENHVQDAICSEAKGTQQDPAYSDVYDPQDVIEVCVKAGDEDAK